MIRAYGFLIVDIRHILDIQKELLAFEGVERADILNGSSTIIVSLEVSSPERLGEFIVAAFGASLGAMDFRIAIVGKGGTKKV